MLGLVKRWIRSMIDCFARPDADVAIFATSASRPALTTLVCVILGLLSYLRLRSPSGHHQVIRGSYKLRSLFSRLGELQSASTRQGASQKERKQRSQLCRGTRHEKHTAMGEPNRLDQVHGLCLSGYRKDRASSDGNVKHGDTTPLCRLFLLQLPISAMDEWSHVGYTYCSLRKALR